MVFFTYTLFCSLFVYDSGVITPSLVQRSFVAYFDNPSPAEKGAIVVCFQVGALFGSLLVGFISDRLGRRKTIAVATLFGIAGGVFMAAAAHIAMLVIGRLLIGVCVGLATSTAPVYAAEIAKASERGRISAAQQLLIAMGFLVANWTGYGFKFTSGNIQWRIPFAIQIFPAVALGFGIFFLPESPRWLMLKGREAEAKAALMRFHFNGTNQDYVDAEYEEIRVKIEAEKLVIAAGWAAAFATPSRRRRLALGSGVWVFAMLSGISFIQYFQPSIYATLNFSVDKQLLVTGLYGSMGPIFCLINLFIVDRVNRVTLLSGAGFTLSGLYIIITAMSARFPAIRGQPVNEAAQYVVVACVFAISCTFSATLGPLGWVYPPEIFQTQLRGVGNSLVHVAHYATSIMITQASPVGLAKIGWRYYCVFCCTNFLSGVVFFFCYPETRGKTLEEIDAIFGDDAVAALGQEDSAAIHKRQRTNSNDEKDVGSF